MVSCVKYCYGCNGGNCSIVFGYYRDAMFSESQWPYSATNGVCNTSSHGTPSNYSNSGNIGVTHNSPSAMRTALNKQPISVAIQADTRSFQTYKSGVYYGTDCGTQLDHAVNIVGYGSENGVDYFLLRNSWGTFWGESGYMKMYAQAEG